MDIQIDPPVQLVPLVRPNPTVATQTAAGSSSHNNDTAGGSRPPKNGQATFSGTPATAPPAVVPGAPVPPPRPAAPNAYRSAQLVQRQLRREQREQKRLQIIERWDAKVKREFAKHTEWVGGSEDPTNQDHALGKQIMGLWESSRPTEGQLKLREAVVADLQAFFDEHWHNSGLKVAPFGSSVTGMYHAASDIDLVVLDPSRPLGVGQPVDSLVSVGDGEAPPPTGLPEWYDVRAVSKAMRKWSSGRWRNIIAIEGANVPIIKLVCSKTNFSVDININNRFGLRNSELIRAYAELHPQFFRPLCFAVKHWLRRRECNDPSGEVGNPTLSSYSIVMLVIQYLQIFRYLPNLQDHGLLDELEVPQHCLWQAPKMPRRRAGDPKPGDANDRRQKQAASYDVTFFEPNVPGSSKKARERRQGGRKAWFNADSFPSDHRLPSLQSWEGEAFARAALPSAASIGLHKYEYTDENNFWDPSKPPYLPLGEAFKGFIYWFARLDKRKWVISINAGRPQALQGSSRSQDRPREDDKPAHTQQESEKSAKGDEKKTMTEKAEDEAKTKAGSQPGDAVEAIPADAVIAPDSSIKGHETTDVTSLTETIGQTVKQLSQIAISTAETHPPGPAAVETAPAEEGQGAAEISASPRASAPSSSAAPPALSTPASVATSRSGQPLEWTSARMVIQDPFILDRNTSKNVARVAADRIQDEFDRAVRILDRKRKGSVQKPAEEGGGGAAAAAANTQGHGSDLDAQVQELIIFPELCLPLEFERALQQGRHRSGGHANGSGSAGEGGAGAGHSTSATTAGEGYTTTNTTTSASENGDAIPNTNANADGIALVDGLGHTTGTDEESLDGSRRARRDGYRGRGGGGADADAGGGGGGGGRRGRGGGRGGRNRHGGGGGGGSGHRRRGNGNGNGSGDAKGGDAQAARPGGVGDGQ